MSKPTNAKALKRGLLSWKDILPWQKDNEFILTGYRRASFSYPRSMRSIFEIHNETADIWSHLLGALQFLVGLLQFLQLNSLANDTAAEPLDVAAVALYYLCVVVCFVLSTVFHTFSDHSADMHRFGELDHLGIVLVMWGTGISGAHFALRCAPGTLRGAYLLLLTAAGVGCAVFTLRPRFRQPTYRTARFLMYCILGASLFAPTLHAWARLRGNDGGGVERLDAMMGLRSFLGLAGINFSGAALYAARVPERWFPGTFDILGQSHNWMHVLVLTGALVRLSGLLDVMERWASYHGLEGYC